MKSSLNRDGGRDISGFLHAYGLGGSVSRQCGCLLADDLSRTLYWTFRASFFQAFRVAHTFSFYSTTALHPSLSACDGNLVRYPWLRRFTDSYMTDCQRTIRNTKCSFANLRAASEKLLCKIKLHSTSEIYISRPFTILPALPLSNVLDEYECNTYFSISAFDQRKLVHKPNRYSSERVAVMLNFLVCPTRLIARKQTNLSW